MTQRSFVGTIKPSKWLALTMSFNISKSRKRRDITNSNKQPNKKPEKKWKKKTENKKIELFNAKH